MRDIIGYEGRYAVTRDGQVWTHLHRRFMRGSVAVAGYRVVSLRKGNKTTVKLVHRLVAEAFLPNPDGKPTVNHKNGVKLDNTTGNLEWATQKEQNAHALVTGLSMNSGETHQNSKNTSAEVEEMFTLQATMTHQAIADLYGVTRGCVTNILAGKSRVGNGKSR